MKDDIMVNVSIDKMMASIAFQIYKPVVLETVTENTSSESDKPEENEDIPEIVTTVTIEEIHQALKDNGVIFGISNELIQEALDEYEPNKKYVVANGMEPTKGPDAYIEYIAKHEVGTTPEELDHGKVNFKELHFVFSVEPGEAVAKKIVAEKGTDGKNVLGEKIDALIGNDIQPRLGKNLQMLGDNLTVVAVMEGQFKVENGVLSIEPLITIDSDIGPATGNVSFLGSVIINGNVLEGYRVKAKGDIEVKGVVEGGILEANGNIVVSYGMHGSDKGILRSQKNILVKFIENSKVEAMGNIVAEAILHSNVKCKGEIMVQTGKGKIVGGYISALKSITAIEVGSLMGTKTKIRIGVEPDVIELYQEIHKSYMTHLDNLNRTNKNVAYLENQNVALSQKKIELLRQAKLLCVNLTNEINLLKFRLKAIEQTMKESSHGTLKAKNWFYEGTEVLIGNRNKIFVENTRGGKCFIYDGEITVTHIL